MEVPFILFLSAYGKSSQYQIGNHMKEILFCPYKNYLFALNFFFNITYTSLRMSDIKGFQIISQATTLRNLTGLPKIEKNGLLSKQLSLKLI